MKFISALLLLCVTLLSTELRHIRVGKIHFLDVKELDFAKKKQFHELSALAYKDGILYSLSDKGRVFHLSLDITEDTIKKVKILKSYPLCDKKGKRLKKEWRDSEGLDFMDNHLLISFEHKHRVALYTTKGKLIKRMVIHPYLRDKKHYLSPNKSLESVTYNDKYKLITIQERESKSSNLHTLYTRNKRYHFVAKGDITEITFIDTDTLLVLTRNFHYITRERESRLYRVWLNSCDVTSLCRSEPLAHLDSWDGYELDNFEGVVQVAKNRYLMISDDNNSFFQKTLLVLFEIVD